MLTNMDIYLLAYNADQTRLEPIALPLPSANSSCVVKLRNLPGASHIRIILQSGEDSVDANNRRETLFRAEVPAFSGETVRFRIRLNATGELEVECPERPLWQLQNKPVDEPLYEQPLIIDDQHAGIDLAIVVDATTRYFPQENNRPAQALLLANKEHWGAHVEKLCRFAETLRAGRELRTAVLAYGDQQAQSITAKDLQPGFLLYPEDASTRKSLLREVNAQQLQTQLLAIPPSSGGDFVDALADALAACNELRWNDEARKWILITGDSPGFSTTQPIPAGDACVRLLDVDTQKLCLQRKGIELLTLYHSPPDSDLQALKAPGLEAQKKLQESAGQQFTHLASLEELAFEVSQFNGEKAAESVLALAGLIGFGGCCGVHVSTQAE